MTREQVDALIEFVHCVGATATSKPGALFEHSQDELYKSAHALVARMLEST